MRIETVLERENLVLAAALAILTLIAGIYTVAGVGMNMSAIEMTRMAGDDMGGNAMPMDGNAMPMDGDGMPMDGDAMPMDGGSTPMGGDAMPAVGDAMPMDGASAMRPAGGEAMAGGMGGMSMGDMAMAAPVWTLGYAALVFLMWWVMMIAMMTPSAAPTVLLHAALRRRMAPEADIGGESARFLLGYLLAWAGFSVIATALQWALELRGLVSPMMMTVTAEALGAAILIAAGLWQLSPLKQVCLEHCRSPAQWLAEHRKRTPLAKGLLHGAFCLGCCWALMALLFFGGIMNLWWILGLAVFVIAEKLLPYGHAIAKTAGAVLLAAGLWMAWDVVA